MTHLRKIGALSAVGLVIGSIVGTGIFVTPSLVARFTTDLPTTLILWTLGGVMCAIGGEIYGKLGQRFPFGGGQYIYLEKCLSKDLALVYGWMSWLVISPSMIASYAMFFGEQSRHFFPQISTVEMKALALLFMALIHAINYFGIQTTGFFEKIIVFSQIALILVLFFVLKINAPAAPTSEVSHISFSLSAFSTAIVGVLWSYEGFNCLSFVAHEVEGAARLLTRYIMIGCAAVVIIYFLLNMMALQFIATTELANTANIAVPLTALAFGSIAPTVTVVVMMIAVLMTSTPAVMIGPRVTEQMAKEGWLPRRWADLHPRYTSPGRAITVQFFVTSLFVLVGSFEDLITCFISVSWCFYILVAIGYLRRHASSAFAVTRAALFITLSAFVLLIQIAENFIFSLIGLGILLVSFFAARNFRRQRERTSPT
jgi:APA family basic amino acid/polyamine antiporter